MFSFHKPKIYRSNLGCCICKAKSSSSRFTDSKKYENEFERCFRIQEKRSGEICNACVLLVKRWKKLSAENRLLKHWHHVVDARAGPGTKLSTGRRLIGSSAHQGSSGNSDNHSSGSGSSSSKDSANCQQQSKHANRTQIKPDVLPLSSNQTGNQSGYVRKRTSSFSSSKALAIDTNVSTFTFGEPNRRSYMNAESFSVASSSSLSKPHSALNSSAFESVIKRYRQRQQQQQLEAQRRKLTRQQRSNQQKSSSEELNKTVESPAVVETPVAGAQDETKQPAVKRQKRSSESIGSFCVDGLRVSSLLDGSVWRKEKLCCGLVFRGPYNEIAVFPKLLKPCQSRLDQLKTKHEDLLIKQIRSPPPRTTKSGSISSCDSNTSGTGSMEQPFEDHHLKQRLLLSNKQRRKSNLRPLDIEEDEAIVLDGESSSSVSSKSASNQNRTRSLAKRYRKSSANTADLRGHSPTASMVSSSSSESSSSTHLILLAEVDDDDEDDEDSGELDEENIESGTDATESSLEGLDEMKSKIAPTAMG